MDPQQLHKLLDLLQYNMKTQYNSVVFPYFLIHKFKQDSRIFQGSCADISAFVKHIFHISLSVQVYGSIMYHIVAEDIMYCIQLLSYFWCSIILALPAIPGNKNVLSVKTYVRFLCECTQATNINMPSVKNARNTNTAKFETTTVATQFKHFSVFSLILISFHRTP